MRDVAVIRRRVRRHEHRRRRSARRSIIWRYRRLLYCATLLGVALLVGLGTTVSGVRLGTIATLDETTYLCSNEVVESCGPANSLAQLVAEQDRLVVPFSEIPPLLISAVLAAEDRDFYRHAGIDPSAIARALLYDFRREGSLQGGSTITQQYVKNTLVSDERTLMRKFREAVLALKVEEKYGKDEILARYLNTIYFGRSAYGVQAASRAYFDRDIASLGLGEVAYLAGLIRSPETADPYDDPDEARFRQSSVLGAMVTTGAIDADHRENVLQTSLRSIVVPRRERRDLGNVRNGENCGTSYFADVVRTQLLERFGPGAYNLGLRVYTTLDQQRQCIAYRSVYDYVLADQAGPAGALVALDRAGRVIALVGGRSYAQSQVNLALGSAGGGSGRQAGSTFKPFALAAFVKDGYSPLSRFEDPTQATFIGADDGADWLVRGGGGSTSTLLEATRQSSNTVYAQLALDLGPQRLADLLVSLGVRSKLRAVPALVLGAAEVSVLDVATAYSNLARSGQDVLPPVVIDRVDDAHGRTLWVPRRDDANSRPMPPVLSEEVGRQVTSVLQEVISQGTGKRAALEVPAAGKTGTTADFRDAWFAGYTCELTASVWLGFVGSANQPVAPMTNISGVREVTGGTLPADIWRRFMSQAGYDSGCRLSPVDYSDPSLKVRAPVPLANATVAAKGVPDQGPATVSVVTIDPKSTTTQAPALPKPPNSTPATTATTTAVLSTSTSTSLPTTSTTGLVAAPPSAPPSAVPSPTTAAPFAR